MACIMDTYSIHMRADGDRCSHRKNSRSNSGCSRGASEATGRGLAVVCDEALRYAEHATRRIQLIIIAGLWYRGVNGKPS